MKTWLIAGGSGMIGRHLTDAIIQRGDNVRWLSRRGGSHDAVEVFGWDPAQGISDPAAFANVNYIVNLAGSGIADHRWTDAYKQDIVQSRLNSISTIREALLSTGVRSDGILCASASGFYGDRKDAWLTEESEPGRSGFLASTTVQWEEASRTMIDLTNVWSMVRIGVVLSRDGGAWPKLSMPARIGVAGYFGRGDQFLPWIHIDDLIRMLLWIVDGQRVGIFNAVAPEPVTGRQLASSMVTANGWGMTMSVPIWIIRMAMGEMADTVLTSARVSCDKATNAGFRFSYTNIQEVVHNLRTV